MQFIALRSLTQPCMTTYCPYHNTYDPGTSPSSANHCILWDVYLRFNLSKKVSLTCKLELSFKVVSQQMKSDKICSSILLSTQYQGFPISAVSNDLKLCTGVTLKSTVVPRTSKYIDQSISQSINQSVVALPTVSYATSNNTTLSRASSCEVTLDDKSATQHCRWPESMASKSLGLNVFVTGGIGFIGTSEA